MPLLDIVCWFELQSQSPGRLLWAFLPWWILRAESSRCSNVQTADEIYRLRRDLPIRSILAPMRHNGCGSRDVNAELLSGIEGVSSCPSEDRAVEPW